MDTNISNSDHEKIFSLIYSNSLPNDKIAFEIIKNLDSSDLFMWPLISVALTSDDDFLSKNIVTFFSEQLKTRHKDYIRIRRTYRKDNRLQHPSLLENFHHEARVSLTYTEFRRSGDCLNDFLCLDDGTHPDRKSVFQTLLNKKHWANPYLIINGMLPDEMEIYAEKIFNLNNNSTYRKIELNYLTSDKIPDLIFTKNYEQVSINLTEDQEHFPTNIFRFRGVKTLRIKIYPHWKIPTDWSAFYELNNLSFDGKDFVFTNFDFVDSLPKLKSMGTGYHALSSPDILLRKKIVPLSRHVNFISSEGYELNSHYSATFKLKEHKGFKLAGAIGKSILSHGTQVYFFKKLTALENLKDLEKLPLNELIALMNVSFTELRNIVQKQLNDICEEQNGVSTLNVKSLLHIAGTPSRRKTEIKKKLKELNISYTDKLNEDITHLIICNNPKKYKQLINRDLQLISEQALYQLFKANAPDFIEAAVSQGDDYISTNILQFINSDNVPNVLVGLEMLKNGGVPNDLIEPLLVVFKTCPDSKARGIAKKLLLHHAPAEWLPLINDTQRFTGINANAKAQDINKKLEKIAKTSSRNLAAQMALMFHKRYKKGLRYILYHFHKPCPERTDALLAMM
ncbi:MAG: BRCT domain-containing protein, partial [Saprospiraceae bacterium]